LLRGGQRGHHAGGAAPDDNDIELDHETPSRRISN